jgi:branched-chain amino acid transport system substrate-binding protein
VSINRKRLGALLGVIAIGIAVASTAGAASQSTPGVTPTQVTIGGTFPLSEPPTPNGASLYATIAGAEQAYYGYVNAPKSHGGLGGVNGRTIKDIVKDDQYTPSETFTKTKQLVESDHVFAIVGSLGTATNLQTMGYLNTKKVPQALLATGDAYWGLCALKGSAFHPIKDVCPKSRPWTIGWQPDYPAEGKQYAKYILNHPAHGGPKIGVLYQNDPYGNNYLAGLVKGLGGHSKIVDWQNNCNYANHTCIPDGAYGVGESPSQIIARVGKLEADGANTLVIFATPGSSIAALIGESAVLHWSPPGGTFLNNVSANRIFMLKAESQGANPAGVISTTYVKSQSSSQFASDKAMALGKQIIYATGNAGLKHEWDIGDNNLVYGLAVAWTFVDALKHAGKNPTRASFMTALRSLNESGKNANPFLYPGMTVKTSASRTFPMQQLEFIKWNGGIHDWKSQGNVVTVGK